VQESLSLQHLARYLPQLGGVPEATLASRALHGYGFEMSSSRWAETPTFQEDVSSELCSMRKIVWQAHGYWSATTRLKHHCSLCLLLLGSSDLPGHAPDPDPQLELRHADGQALHRLGQAQFLLISISLDRPAYRGWSYTSRHMATSWTMGMPYNPSPSTLPDSENSNEQGAKSKDNVGDCTGGCGGQRSRG